MELTKKFLFLTIILLKLFSSYLQEINSPKFIKLTLDDIKNYCPIYKFHPNEKYFPCSIEYLLKNSTLYSRKQNDFLIINPSQENLEQYSESEYYLNISSSNYEGDIINAPVYVTVNEINQTFIDINYIVLYAYSGGIVFNLQTFFGLSTMNGIINTYGHHQGDLERIFVRLYIELDGKLKLYQFGYEQHGFVHLFNPRDKNLFNLTHPIVFVSLNLHASYDSSYITNINDSNIISLEKRNYYLLKFTVADAISNNGIEWKPFEKIQIFGLYSGLPINEQRWIKFQGRIGNERNSTLESATELDGNMVSPIKWAIIKIFGEIFLKIVNIPVDQLKELNGNGPTGPSDRIWVNTLQYDKNTHSYTIWWNTTSSNILFSTFISISQSYRYYTRPTKSLRLSFHVNELIQHDNAWFLYYIILILFIIILLLRKYIIDLRIENLHKNRN